MIAVSLPFLIGCSPVVSAALTWLNIRGAGVFGAAGATLVVCIAIVIIQSMAFGSAALTRQGAQSWPLTFVVAVTAVMVTHNILFASVRSQ